MQVTLIEKSSLVSETNKIVDKSATLAGTKTLHTGTYYTHRGHSRGQDPNEKKLLVTLTEETSRDYHAMMQLLKEYGLEPRASHMKTLYLMFNDAFVEPYYFENITKEQGLWTEKIPQPEFERLNKIFSSYKSPDGRFLQLEGAFETKDALIDLISLLKKFESEAKELGVILYGDAVILSVKDHAVSIAWNNSTLDILCDCIVNATNAFCAKTALSLGAEAPPRQEYIIEYRHIGWIDKKAAPIFNAVTQGKYAYFRLFHGDTKVTIAEVNGDNSKICFYAPELIRVDYLNPDAPFINNAQYNQSLVHTAERLGIDTKNSSFFSYIGMTPYMRDGNNLLHQTETKTGIPVMNAMLEKMSGFMSVSPQIADWVGTLDKGKIMVTIIGAGKYGSHLIGPKYIRHPKTTIQAVISPSVNKDLFDQTILGKYPLFRTVQEWKKQFGGVSDRSLFDLSIHADVLYKVVTDLVDIGAKNFVFPKPLARTAKELEALQSLVSRNALKVVVSSQWQYAKITHALRDLYQEFRKQHTITRIHVNFSQFFDDKRLLKYTCTTALLPHILQIMCSLGVDYAISRVEKSPHKVLVHAMAGQTEIVLESDVRAETQTRLLTIYENQDPIIEADFLALYNNERCIKYPSLRFRGKNYFFLEDDLEKMTNVIVEYFDGNNPKEIMDFEHYLPIAHKQVEIEALYFGS